MRAGVTWRRVTALTAEQALWISIPGGFLNGTSEQKGAGMTQEEKEMAVQRVAVILSGQPSICAASADGTAVDVRFWKGTRLRLLAVEAAQEPS
jgi:hypothetical protein